jgi:hypothetical protein
MKFMLMMHAPRGNGDWNVAKWAHEDVVAMVAFMKKLNEDLTREGKLVGAEGLTAPSDARIVRAGKGGVPEVTDGPFAETKEFLAGYWIVDVATKEEAYAIAARASAAPGPGRQPLNMAIEVRPVGSAPA